MSVRQVLICCMLACAAFASAARPIRYNGDTLELNKDFRRKQCGTLITKNTMREISGIACSRVTPGYIWMESDDVSNKVIATTEKGDSCYLSLSLTLAAPRWDWEDMCGGVYDGKNYIFIGAIGDNNETGGEYYIHYFEEPEIPSVAGTRSRINASSINFQYPEGKKHNAEAIMYDNREQMLYVITKKYYKPCQVFSLPFRLDYGTELQTLTYVCDLGIQADLGDGAQPFKGFHLVTAADISPDGKFILIKNHNNTNDNFSWTLIWTREDDESVGDALKRQPQNIQCYQPEWQGEAMCWLDSTIFYTTSDDDGDPPIYKYIKNTASAVETVRPDAGKSSNSLVLIDRTLYIRSKEGLYTMDGQRVR